jgi:serine/threonine protein kinase/tetratricopeptide (TPR) repeat protein
MPDPISRLNAALAGRYRIEGKLGEGGMATVYLARDEKHGRNVAVKVLKPELAPVIGAERFLTEIETTAKLHHPHILPLFDSGEADGFLFYVMPYVEGDSLRDLLDRERQLAADQAVRIATAVAGALDYAHRQGVIHRDIKPANILIHDGEPLVSDFGIALAVTQGDRLTSTGLSVGTPAYMSPEQATGERDLDARSDVYSLAAVTYEMLAGEPPVTGATPRAMIASLLVDPPKLLGVAREGIPSSVETAVMQALAKASTDRFATAREFAEALAGRASGLEASPRGRGRESRRRSLATLALAGIGVVSIAVVARHGLSPDTMTAGVGSDVPAEIRSIAVLPLDNYSGDPAQDYFAEGMTDELTATLATISRIRVISRGSAMQFQGRDRPPTPQIAEALNVDAVVEGSVVRSGDRVRIIAQLIDARADKHLWAQSFERSSDDVLVLQAELAAAIAREINVRLTEGERSRFASAASVDPGAHDAYLRGRYFFNRPSDENLKKAIEAFEEAVARDSSFAPALSGLSDAYLWAGYNEGFTTASDAKPRARAAAKKAVALDPSSAEAHTSLAVFKLFYELDWRGSEAAFRRAIALNPNYGYAHDQYSMLLAFTGRFEESEAESRIAAQLDPLSPQVLVDAAVGLIFQKDSERADELMRRALELDPTYFFPVMVKGWARLDKGQFREAIPFLERSRTMGAPPFVTAFIAYAYGASGDEAKAMAELETLREASPGRQVAPFNLALVHLGLGEHARAIEELERAREADSQFLGWLGQDAIFDPLRLDPRFVALLKELNFVD